MRNFIFACIVGLANGFMLSSSRFADTTNHSTGLTIQPAEFALIAHHKTGTVLLKLLTEILGKELHMKTKVFQWKAVDSEQNRLSWLPDLILPDLSEIVNTMSLRGHFSSACNENTLVFFEDMRPKVFNKLMERCNGPRTVHLVRRPSDVVASNFAYTKSLSIGEERFMDVTFGALLKALPPSQGLKLMCEIFHIYYANQMLTSHRIIQEKRSNLMLEVRYEDFVTNFDNTTRTIFEHLLGKTHTSVNNLVTKARAHDRNRMAQSEIDKNKHISNEKDKAEIRHEMVKLLKAGNSCMARLQKDDELMGYTEPWY